MNALLDIDDTRNKDAIEHSQDWRGATVDLLTFWIDEGRCFSSGEVAAALRVHRPSLFFTVPDIGERIRDLFWSDSLMEYTLDDMGNTAAPVQVSRFTTGRFPDRTPANTEVFVYGPDSEACDAHEFEIFVPKWDKGNRCMETMADAPAPAVNMPSAQTATGTTHAQDCIVVFGTRIATQDIRASVWVDNRLAVPRRAFEALCHLTGTPIRAGDKVYVKVMSGDKVLLTLEDDGSGEFTGYSPVKDKGNVAFGSGDTSNPFPAGAVYQITVDTECISVDLSKNLATTN